MIHYIPINLVIDEDECLDCGMTAEEVVKAFMAIKDAQPTEINGIRINFEMPNVTIRVDQKPKKSSLHFDFDQNMLALELGIKASALAQFKDAVQVCVDLLMLYVPSGPSARRCIDQDCSPAHRYGHT